MAWKRDGFTSGSEPDGSGLTFGAIAWEIIEAPAPRGAAVRRDRRAAARRGRSSRIPWSRSARGPNAGASSITFRTSACSIASRQIVTAADVARGNLRPTSSSRSPAALGAHRRSVSCSDSVPGCEAARTRHGGRRLPVRGHPSRHVSDRRAAGRVVARGQAARAPDRLKRREPCWRTILALREVQRA